MPASLSVSEALKSPQVCKARDPPKPIIKAFKILVEGKTGENSFVLILNKFHKNFLVEAKTLKVVIWRIFTLNKSFF